MLIAALVTLAGCFSVTSDISDQIPSEQTDRPVFSPGPEGGPFSQPITVTITAPSNDAVIFYAGGDSVNVDFEAWTSELFGSSIWDSDACLILFEHINHSLQSEMTDLENPDSWVRQIISEVALNTVSPSLGIPQETAENCMALFGGMQGDQPIDFSVLAEADQGIVDDCLILYSVINDSVEEDLQAWMDEFENLDNATLQQCNDDLLVLNQSITQKSQSFLYSGPFIVSRNTLISAIAYEEGKLPSAVVTKEYTFSNSYICNSQNPCSFGYTCVSGTCLQDGTFGLPECVIDETCGPGKRCVQGKCENLPAAECAINTDCEVWELCNAYHLCVNNPNYSAPCTSNANCTLANQYCDISAGICKTTPSNSCVTNGCNTTQYCDPYDGNCKPNNAVPPNIAPTILLINPLDGDEILSTQRIIYGAAAADIDGEIENVSFFYNGSRNPVGTVYQAEYILLASNFGVGSYELWATGYDNNGAIGSSNVAKIRIIGDVSTNVVPSVQITSPTNGALFYKGQNILISASAQDEDGAIASVQFLKSDDSTTSSLYIDNAGPYSYNWVNVPSGDYYLAAKATDNNGGTKFSNPIFISVLEKNLDMRASPMWIVTEDDFVEVTCDVNAPNIKINLYRGTTLLDHGTNKILSNSVKLPKGNYTYKCTANDTSIADKTNTLIVTESNMPPILLFNELEWTSWFNFTSFNRTDFRNLSGVFFRSTYGRIDFLEPLNIIRNLDLRGYFIMHRNQIFINSSHLPEFNAKARLEFFNVNFENPTVFRDGVLCPQTICSDEEYNRSLRKFSFEVKGFSNYTVSDKPICGDGFCGDHETCTSCNKDCGICGATDPLNWCHPEWECTTWGECRSDGFQIRTCNDKYDCGTLKDIPALYQQCGTQNIPPPADDFEDDADSNLDVDTYVPPPANNENDASKDLPEKSTEFNYMNIVYLLLILIIIGGIVAFVIIKKRNGENILESVFGSNSNSTQNKQPQNQQYQNQNRGISPQLRNQANSYISTMRTRGYSDAQIRERMKSAGWTDEQLSNVL